MRGGEPQTRDTVIFVIKPPSAFVFVLSLCPTPSLECVLGTSPSDCTRFICVPVEGTTALP